jgi:hypothetical protein
MTINAFHPGLLKFQRCVALSATDLPVLTDQRKFGCAMVESQCFKINLPTF